MSAIGKGDWVECVDAEAGSGMSWRFDEEVLTKGALYRVAEVFVNRVGLESLALCGRERNRGSAHHGFRVGYAPRRFRPLYRPQEHAFDYLLENLPAELEREGVSA